MKSTRNTKFYSQVLKELHYDFGVLYVFQGVVVLEINENVLFTWDNHAKTITEDVSCFFGTDGSDIIYISNRMNSYSIMATDWLKFFKNSYSLKGYYVVGDSLSSMVNTAFENLFFKSKIKKFTTIEDAIEAAFEKHYEFTVV